jgi:hypothetical protein
MNSTKLFAIDAEAQEVIVSESPKGSRSIHFLERIKRADNEILYNAVLTLTSLSKAADLDMAVFKGMDKICQLIYAKQKGE